MGRLAAGFAAPAPSLPGTSLSFEVDRFAPPTASNAFGAVVLPGRVRNAGASISISLACSLRCLRWSGFNEYDLGLDGALFVLRPGTVLPDAVALRRGALFWPVPIFAKILPKEFDGFVFAGATLLTVAALGFGDNVLGVFLEAGWLDVGLLAVVLVDVGDLGGDVTPEDLPELPSNFCRFATRGRSSLARRAGFACNSNSV